jgi:Zn-dependent protease
MQGDDLILLPVWYAVFLLSLTCHEAAHAWVARRGGDSTAYEGGQVTLDPRPHIQREPFGTVLVPLLAYFNTGWMIGWASAPYDPRWEDRHPQRAAWMAAAGPAANLLLALLGFALLRAGLATGAWEPWLGDAVGQVSMQLDRLVAPPEDAPGWLDGLARFGSILLGLNAVLFVFNLLPLPPMDGAAILAGLVPPARRIRDRLRGNMLVSIAGLVVAWYVFARVFWPLFTPVVLALWGPST